MDTGIIFWEQIAAKIEILTKAYHHAVFCVNTLNLKVSADSVDNTNEENEENKT